MLNKLQRVGKRFFMRYIFTLNTREVMEFAANTKREKCYAWRAVSRHCRRFSTRFVKTYITNGQPVRVVSFTREGV